MSEEQTTVNGQHRPHQSETLAAALYYHDHDCFVVPCCVMDEQGQCSFPHEHLAEKNIGKVPIIGIEWQNTRLTRSGIIWWWTKHPTANVGVLLEPSSLLVVDLDSADAIEEASAKGLPPGPHVRSSKGVHHYFRNPKHIVALTVGRGESHKIDVLSKGIAVGFGSRHHSGKRYELLTSWEDWPPEDPPLWAEAWLLESLAKQSSAVQLSNDLPPVDLEALAIPRWVHDVIRHGQSAIGEQYPSRSEAVWAVTAALVEAGCDDDTIASILLDPRFAISAKPREHGCRWIASEIGRARAKTTKSEGPASAPHGTQNGTGPAVEIADDEEEETEEEENIRVMQEERTIDDPYPCPAHLFRGAFRHVADTMGKQTWEVWTATLVALGAKAHRNIEYKYHRMLYGMVYAVLIKGTGMGKGLSTDLCRGLMPSWYVIRDAVQSGPALAPLLADIVRGQKGKVESCTSRPALLLIEEFTVLLKNAGIQHSTLIDSLNSLFHRPWPWNISRSDRPNSGGGDLVIQTPTLSILATTTEALFKEYVSPQMIRSGFLNRYLVLPGDSTPWKFYDPDGAGKIINQNLGLFDHISVRKVGDGHTVWDAYEPPALARLTQWGADTFEPIMRSTELDAESVKRLHVYAHVIALLYAWSDHRVLVNFEDVECSITVIETARAFLHHLVADDRPPEVPKFQAYEIHLEQRILAKVAEAAEQGVRRRTVVRHLQRHATTPALYLFLTKMVQSGTLREVAEKVKGAKKPVYKLYLPEHNPERKKKQKK